MAKTRKVTTTLGPLAYENWRTAIEGGAPGPLLEYHLFSDVAFTAHRWSNATCPYELVSVARETSDVPRTPAAVVRLRYFSRTSIVETDASSQSAYHGGTLVDEVAALVGLLFGIRVKPGKNYSRRWGFNDDILGEPICTEEPLEVPTSSRTVLPRARGYRKFADLGQLLTLPELESPAATALILAARSYQEAIWIADRDPNYAWLLLVSAAETAASAWSMAVAPPLDRMKISRPELVKILVEAGGEDLAVRVAEQIADYMGATKKFRDFLLHFLPDPPAERAPDAYQVVWEKKYFKKALEKIYGYRSRALHGGVAFPWPLCEPPSGLEEKPTWHSATTSDGHKWYSKDVPMLLHTFEFIVRGALLRWWESLVPTEPTTA